jgi:putative flavoprotein involved in K+ transport
MTIRTSVAVIGAGQAGLAVSHLLGRADVDHVVLERGRTGERWLARPWRSLRLLTPNWLSRLPGWRYTGPDPEGYLPARGVAGYLSCYAAASAAPVVHGADVHDLRRDDDGYRIATGAGSWSARAAVIATGWCDRPLIPATAAGLALDLPQYTAATYRDPGHLPDGGVLVVGASATGVQVADELAADGRHVVLAVGSHNRLPRRYRGLDILWWLDTLGLLDRRTPDRLGSDAVPADPSVQLVGRADARDVDLPSLQARGVQLAGRFRDASDHRVRFADALPTSTETADRRLVQLLRRIDSYAHAVGLDDELLPPPETLPRARVAAAPLELDLAATGIRSVVWATGYRRAYPWLRVPVLGADGEIRHVRGTTPAPGLHVAGMRLQTRRNSTFLDGVRHDAAVVVGRILEDLGAPRQAAAVGSAA